MYPTPPQLAVNAVEHLLWQLQLQKARLCCTKSSSKEETEGNWLLSLIPISIAEKPDVSAPNSHSPSLSLSLAAIPWKLMEDRITGLARMKLRSCDLAYPIPSLKLVPTADSPPSHELMTLKCGRHREVRLNILLHKPSHGTIAFSRRSAVARQGTSSAFCKVPLSTSHEGG